MIINQPPPELYAERPVRSVMEEEGGGLSYRTRRILTLSVLAAAIAALAAWPFIGGSLDTEPAVVDLPVIKAETTPYKQRPEQSGGMAIPHQDVEVYGELESSTKQTTKPNEEKLLPPSEAPLSEYIDKQVVPDMSVLSSVPITGGEVLANANKTADALTSAELPPLSAPSAAVPDSFGMQAEETGSSLQDIMPAASPPRALPAPTVGHVMEPATPVESLNAPVVAADPPVSEKTPEKKQEGGTQEISLAPLAKTKTSSKTQSVVQLASVPGRDQAELLQKQLRKQYAGLLGETDLRVVRADLGAKGIYFRIQTAPVPSDQANSLCAALKQQKAGCFIVRP